jgi:hypothetical protein
VEPQGLLYRQPTPKSLSAVQSPLKKTWFRQLLHDWSASFLEKAHSAVTIQKFAELQHRCIPIPQRTAIDWWHEDIP